MNPRRAVVPALLLAVSPVLAWAGPYDGLAARKDSLGSILVVADVMMYETAKDHAIKVYLDDSKTLGQGLVAGAVDLLTKKGYHVRAARLSVGRPLVGPSRCYPTWDQRGEDAEKFPILDAPFYVDSTAATDSVTHDAWRAAFERTWAEWHRKKNDPPITVVVDSLRSALGEDHLLIAQVSISRVSGKKRFGLSLVGLKKPSGTSIHFTLVDGRTGAILWDRSAYWEDVAPKVKEGSQLAADMLKKLP